MTNRTNWEFTYGADTLLKAAADKHNHHKARMEWWEAKKVEVISEVKAEGLEIDESVANITSNSYNRGATVHVRTDLMRDLQECVEKIREHREYAEGYDAWVQVLASQGEETFNLHQDDWMFFFGKRNFHEGET